ncbi:MAG: hypothetical protein C0397_13730 [Odoribacter sp.]|nr:hypothetical protein [Odoribacter sp.]
MIKFNQFLDLRYHKIVNIIVHFFQAGIRNVFARIKWIKPFVQRIIQANFQPFFAGGSKVFTKNVLFRAHFHRITVGIFGWPQAKTIVMLRGYEHVFGAHLFGKPGPIGWVIGFGFPLPDKLVVGEFVSVFLAVVQKSWIVFFGHPFSIPFGIRNILLAGGPGRYGIYAPVHTQSDFGIVVPFRHFVRIERLPGWLIGFLG